MKRDSGFTAQITLIATGVVFLLLVVTMILSNFIVLFFIRNGLISTEPDFPLAPFLFQSGIISILTGTGITLCMGHLPLRPIRTLIKAIHEVSEGNFDVKIHLERPKEFRRLSQSFNQMTEELKSIEILRSDFINNFSHEFKTPIVSILGFARLLKKGRLSREEAEEYLDIIIDESNRLSRLSTTVLNLTKVESLSMLSDKTRFSISEQIREAILLLEKKWEKKNIDFDLDMEELSATASEALLKQVWLNLIDNSIKFSPQGGHVGISLKKERSHVLFSITDDGPGMDEQTKKYIFDKFYQGDTSHAMEGNGLGLPLVKKIVELHKGSVSVVTLPGSGSAFTVSLPLK